MATAKSKASTILASLERQGWVYDGDIQDELRPGDYDDDPSLDRSYEHMTITVSLKRRRP